MNIRQVVNESDTFSGRAFDFVVFFLIVFSIITLTIDTLPDLPPFVSDALDISEIVITVLFTIEYLVRIAAAPKKIGYILSFYGIVDLIAILPFYIALGVDLRAVRAFRLFRIIRILKLTRYSRAMERFAKALSYAKDSSILYCVGCRPSCSPCVSFVSHYPYLETDTLQPGYGTLCESTLVCKRRSGYIFHCNDNNPVSSLSWNVLL